MRQHRCSRGSRPASRWPTPWSRPRPATARRRTFATGSPRIQGFARLFDRALRTLARADRDEIARGFAVLARLPDESLDRLLGLFGSLPEEELARTLDSISRVSPATARRILTTADRLARIGR